MTLEELLQLKKKVESLTREESQLEGRLQQWFSQLFKNHQCENLEEAQQLINTIQEEIDKEEESFVVVLDNFNQLWKEKYSV